MSDEERPDEEVTEAPAIEQTDEGGPKRWLVIGGGLFLILTLSQGIAPHLTSAVSSWFEPEPAGGEAKQDAADEKIDLSQPPIYLALDPPFIVNFQSQDRIRFLQVTIEVMSRSPEVIEQLEAHAPVIRNNLLLLFGSQDEASLGTRDGKEQLRQQTLQEIQTVLRQETGRAGVEAVYFTSFVMQ